MWVRHEQDPALAEGLQESFDFLRFLACRQRWPPGEYGRVRDPKPSSEVSARLSLRRGTGEHQKGGESFLIEADPGEHAAERPIGQHAVRIRAPAAEHDDGIRRFEVGRPRHPRVHPVGQRSESRQAESDKTGETQCAECAHVTRLYGTSPTRSSTAPIER